MADEVKTEAQQQEEIGITFAEFLEGVPPSQATKVSDLAPMRLIERDSRQANWIATPQLRLHCTTEACNGTRFFRYTGSRHVKAAEVYSFIFMRYLCSNCRKETKTYSLAIRLLEEGGLGDAYKFGELPEYGPPTPSRLIKLIGDDREIFLKGLTSESQGLGIGAFGYYRHVVEKQKNRILDHIINVAKKAGSDQSVRALEAAKRETQVSDALKSVKDAIPPTLLIDGHNPLSLLHSALNEDLHTKTDEECMEYAHDFRIVLSELAERISLALKDEAELKSSISRLLNRNQESPSK